MSSLLSAPLVAFLASATPSDINAGPRGRKNHEWSSDWMPPGLPRSETAASGTGVFGEQKLFPVVAHPRQRLPTPDSVLSPEGVALW